MFIFRFTMDGDGSIIVVAASADDALGRAASEIVDRFEGEFDKDLLREVIESLKLHYAKPILPTTNCIVGFTPGTLLD